jgi:hypothetical protein
LLQVFHLYVSKVDLVLQQVFHMHISSVSSAFRRMLQVLHLDVSKVDWMLHLSPHFFLPCIGVSSSTAAGHPPPLPLFLDVGDARADAEPAWARETVRETTYRRGRPSGRPGASHSDFSRYIVLLSIYI